MKNRFVILLSGAVLITAGCSTPQTPRSGHLTTPNDLAALQGSWGGRVVQGDTKNPCSFVVSGTTYEFHDLAETNVWYKGTFSLREETTPRQFVASISDCPFPQYIGKSATAIYRIGHGNLTITANEPGSVSIPATFDAPDASRLEVTRSMRKD
jgi:uncharacterized protein (TIGR03067 family)